VKWTRSRPLARPSGLRFHRIPFAVSQTAQVVSKVFADGHHLIFLHFARKTFNPWAGLKTANGRARHSVRAVVVNPNAFVGNGGRLPRPAGRGLTRPTFENLRAGRSVPDGPPGRRQEPFPGRAALPRSPLFKGGATATALPCPRGFAVQNLCPSGLICGHEFNPHFAIAIPHLNLCPDSSRRLSTHLHKLDTKEVMSVTDRVMSVTDLVSWVTDRVFSATKRPLPSLT
jgi:hypothetical protein